MFNARQTAFEVLLKIEKESAYSNIALDKLLSKSDLDTRDKAFVSHLFYGVIERKLTLDYQLSQYLERDVEKLKLPVLIALRLGVYQILFSEKVPTSAAVNESVKLVKNNGCAFACGLVNAVLHKVGKNGLKLPSQENFSEYISVKYSCPQWLVNKWIKELGKEDTESMLASSLGSQNNYIRVNTTLISKTELIKLMENEGVTVSSHKFDNTLIAHFNGKSVENLDSYKNGYFHVQDAACQMCVAALDPQKGQRVFDMCAAPGGKSYTIAEIMQDSGEVLSFDIHEHRVKLIESGAQRLKLKSIKAMKGDALKFNETLGLADRVLCDVPCSGLGIIGKKPEIKYKDPDEIKALPKIQLEILKNSSKYVKVGGRLVYSTCTVSKSENEKVCTAFLKDNKSFKPVKPLESFFDDEFITLLPHKNGCDGFFIACFERTDI